LNRDIKIHAERFPSSFVPLCIAPQQFAHPVGPRSSIEVFRRDIHTRPDSKPLVANNNIRPDLPKQGFGGSLREIETGAMGWTVRRPNI
jgi:hypothetical protein